MKWRRVAVWYFLAQALAVVGWWLMLAFVPTTRAAFAIRGASFAALGSFALGDLGIIALGSAMVAVRNGQGWTAYAAWAVSGALLYGSCYVALAAATGVSSSLGAALMIPASLASIVASVILSRDANADRLPSGTAT